MIPRVAALAFAAILISAAAARAQEAQLERVLSALASSWARGDAVGLAASGAAAGLVLEIDGETIGPLAPRQAAAVLRRLFVDRETVRLDHGMARVVGGSPLRAFGEFAWIARADGTTIPERAVVFVAFVWEDDAWRITQIRLLR
jgi:hypothetical protein